MNYQCLSFDNGIKTFHQFTFDKEKPWCSFRELSNKGEWIGSAIAEITDFCETEGTNEFIDDSLSQLVPPHNYNVEQIIFCSNEYEELSQHYSQVSESQDTPLIENLPLNTTRATRREKEAQCKAFFVENNVLNKGEKVTKDVLISFLKKQQESDATKPKTKRWNQKKDELIDLVDKEIELRRKK